MLYTDGIRRAPRGLLTLAFASLTSLAQAQMGPPGGGGPGGGMPPGRGAAPAEQRQPTLEDLMPPNPLRVWRERLAQEAPALALTADQAPLFQAFVRELEDAARLNDQRRMRAMRQRPTVVSATVDVARDLRQEAEDAQDWAQAMTDLGQRWQALRQALTPAQQDRVDGLYRDSREAGGPPPGDTARRPPPTH